MTATQIEFAGPIGCPRCDGGMIRDGSRVRCGSCTYHEGVVTYADRLEHHRKLWRAANPGQPAPKRSRKKVSKLDRIRARLDDPQLFDSVIRPTHDRTTAGVELAEVRAPVPVTPVVVDYGTSRCGNCDRLFTVVHGKIVCPACGAVQGDANALGMLMRAFGGTIESRL